MREGVILQNRKQYVKKACSAFDGGSCIGDFRSKTTTTMEDRISISRRKRGAVDVARETDSSRQLRIADGAVDKRVLYCVRAQRRIQLFTVGQPSYSACGH